MRIHRRNFLTLSAAGAATLFLPDPRRGRGSLRAQSQSTTPFLVCLEAQNGWDPTFLVDPKANLAFTPWAAADIRSVQSIRYAPNLLADGSKPVYRVGLGNDDFFVKHGSKIVVVNGIDNSTVSHDVGPRVAFTGSNREGTPSLPGLLAASAGPTLPMSLMTTSGFVNAEGLVPVTRAGNVGVLLGLARSNIPNPAVATSARRFHDDEIQALVRERVRARDARRAASAHTPRELAGVLRLAPSRSAEVVAQFDQLAASLDAASSVSSTNPIIPKAAACLAAMSAGACIAAHLETDESFDTHNDHDADHPVSMQHLLEIMDFILDRAESDPVLAERGVLIVVGSDFGRTRYNPDGGKDHWPITSMMVAGAGAASSLVEGGRAVGETVTRVSGDSVNGLVAHKLKLVDGDLVPTTDDDPAGIVMTAGHVHLALRESLGLAGTALAERFPLTTVVPQTPLPILKRV